MMCLVYREGNGARNSNTPHSGKRGRNKRRVSHERSCDGWGCKRNESQRISRRSSCICDLLFCGVNDINPSPNRNPQTIFAQKNTLSEKNVSKKADVAQRWSGRNKGIGGYQPDAAANRSRTGADGARIKCLICCW